MRSAYRVSLASTRSGCAHPAQAAGGRRPPLRARRAEIVTSQIADRRFPATTSDTFSGMQLEERPGPPGPYAAPDEIAPPTPDVSTGGTRHADIEYARVMGCRPLRMDLLLPPAPSGPVPVVVWIHGGAFLFGSRLHGPVTEKASRALIDRGVAVALV